MICTQTIITNSKYDHIYITNRAHTRHQFHRPNDRGTTKLTSTPNTMVEMAPPMKPSQVFFGDNLIRGVRPKKKPNMYAIMSLQIIIDTGTRNLSQYAYRAFM